MRIVVLLTVTATLTAGACQELPSQQLHGAAPREARAQTDSIGRIFRELLVEVAAASELPRLDSTTLLRGARREIRIYSIGVGQPHIVRAWADTAYDCRAIKQSRAMNVCWLAPRAGRVVWAQLLARLDSLGIDWSHRRCTGVGAPMDGSASWRFVSR